MLASPPLLPLLLLSFISAISTFVLLLLPILPSLSIPTLFPRRTLPRSFYPHLPPRPSTSTSSVSSLVHSVGITLAAAELVVTVLALWQQLLLFSTSGKNAGQDNVGEGIRMGLALILRPVVWTGVVVFLVIRAQRNSPSSTRVDRSFNSVSTLSTPRSFLVAGAVVVAVGALVGLFAGVSSASLSSTYGLTLIGGSVLMIIVTVGVAALVYQTLSLRQRQTRVRVSRGEKEIFKQGEWKAEETAVFVEKPKRGEGWGEGESWLSSPTASNASLPAFDLSLTPTSARNSAANITTSRPTTPFSARAPSPYYNATPHPPRMDSPSSWLSSPEEPARAMSPWSFDSSNQTALTANITESSSIFRAPGGPPSPLYTPSDPFASLQPVVAVRPPSTRVVSVTSSRSSFAPLSPPPAIPLPPTPSMMALSDGRPSTSTEFRPSFSDWTRPSTTDFHSTDAFTSVPGFSSIPEDEPKTQRYIKRESIRESEDALVGDGARRREERWADAELGRVAAQELDEADYRKLARRSWLGVAALASAWLAWALAMPTMVDSLTRPSALATESLTLSLIVSFALSSPVTLILYLLFRSAYFTPFSPINYDTITPYNHHRTNARMSTRTVSGLSFSDGPVRPSIDMDLDVPPVPQRKTAKQNLRRLTLVESNKRSAAAAGIQGRCMSPNEEGNMAETWIQNGLAKPEASRFSRVLSMLGPNPPLQQLPSSRISYHSMPTPPPRAASPASSYASSQSSRASASRMSNLRSDPQETFESFRSRAQSNVSVHHATVMTATRGTRGSMEMGKLVDLSPTVSQTEFGVRPGGKPEVRVVEGGQDQQGLSLDWMTSKLLPNLVPSIRVGKGVQVRPEVKVTPSAHEPPPQASILRARSAYEPRVDAEEDIELTPRRPTTSQGMTSRGSHTATPAGSPSSTSNESTPRSNPRERTAGATAPTPSHGRSSSIEINGRGSAIFNSPSVMASTPLRSITQRVRPQPGSAHKSHFSLPPVTNGQGWGQEVRQALDQFSVGSRASLRSRRSYSVVNVQDDDEDDLAFLPSSIRPTTFGPTSESSPLDSVSEQTGSDLDEESETEEEVSVDEFDFGLDGFGDLDSVDVISFDEHQQQASFRPTTTTFQDHLSPPSTAGIESRHMSRDIEDLLAEMQVVRQQPSAAADLSMPRTVSPPSVPRAQGLSSSLPLSSTQQHTRKPSKHDFDAGSPRPFYQPRLTLHRSASAASSVFSTLSSPSPSPLAQRAQVHLHGAQKVKVKQQSLDGNGGKNANRGLRPLSLSGSAVSAKNGAGKRLPLVGEQDENEEPVEGVGAGTGEKRKMSAGSRILGEARPVWSARPIR